MEYKLYFDSKINALLMNSEMMFAFAYRPQSEDELYQPEYQSMMNRLGNNDFPFPTIDGQYLNDVLAKKKERDLKEQKSSDRSTTVDDKQTNYKH